MTRQITDGLFVELEYFTPENYLVYVAEAETNMSASVTVSADGVIADTSGYYIFDYIEEGYYSTGTVVEVSCSMESQVTQETVALRIFSGIISITDAFVATVAVSAIVNSFAVLDAVFDLESTVNKTVDPGGLLEFFADLNTAAAKIVDPELAFDAEFSVNGNSGIGDIGFNVIYDNAANLTVDAAISCDADVYRFIEVASNISAAASITADAIEYQVRPNPYTRPNNWVDVGTLDAIITNEVSGYNLVTPGAVIVGDTVVGNRRLQNQNVNLAFQTATSSAGDFFVSFLYAANFRETTDPSSIPLAVYGINGDASWTISENRYTTSGETYRTLVATLKKSDGSTVTLGGATTETAERIPNTGQGYWIQVRLFADGDGNNTGFSWRWMDGSTLKTSRQLQTTKFNFYTPATANQTLQLAPSESYLYDDFVVYQGTRDVKFRGTYGFQTGGYVPYYNDETLSVIYTPFDTNLNDITKLTVDPILQFNSAFAQTVSALALKEASAELNVVVEQSTAATKIQEASADFDAVASQLTAAGKVGDFFVNADIIANLAIDPDLFKEYTAELESATTQTASAVKTVDIELNLSSVFNSEIETDGFKRISADLTAVSTIDATATRYQPGAADLNVVADILVNVVTVTDTDAALSSEFTQTDVDFVRYRDTDAALEVAGSQLSVVVKTADFFVNADIVATLEIIGVIKAGVVVEGLDNTVTMTTVVERIRDDSAAFESVSSAEASGVFVTDTDADLAVAATINIDAQRFVGVETDFEAIATQLTAIGKIAPYTAGLDSEFAISVNAVKTTDTDADIQSAASAEITATRIKTLAAAISSETTASAELTKITGFAADLNTTATVTAEVIVKVFNLEQYIYTIPAETRTYTIQRETRSHSVTEETRTYTIEGT